MARFSIKTIFSFSLGLIVAAFLTNSIKNFEHEGKIGELLPNGSITITGATGNPLCVAETVVDLPKGRNLEISLTVIGVDGEGRRNLVRFYQDRATGQVLFDSEKPVSMNQIVGEGNKPGFLIPTGSYDLDKNGKPDVQTGIFFTEEGQRILPNGQESVVVKLKRVCLRIQDEGQRPTPTPAGSPERR